MNIIVIIYEKIESGLGALFGLIGIAIAIMFGLGAVVSWPVILKYLKEPNGGDYSLIITVGIFLFFIVIAFLASCPGLLFIVFPVICCFMMFLSNGGFWGCLMGLFAGACLAVVPALIIGLIRK